MWQCSKCGEFGVPDTHHCKTKLDSNNRPISLTESHLIKAPLDIAKLRHTPFAKWDCKDVAEILDTLERAAKYEAALRRIANHTATECGGWAKQALKP